MTLTPDLSRSIDQIRDYLYGGGYPNPAQNAEQLSFLMFFFMFEAMGVATGIDLERLVDPPADQVLELIGRQRPRQGVALRQAAPPPAPIGSSPPWRSCRPN